MIPKIIHYCWFGKGKMPELAVKCIESWKKYLPGYELKLWNEEMFDINSIRYVKEAYNVRKYAFVTDYVRLYALFQEGGIYMDTDVEMLKSLDDLLYLPAFSGFESEKHIQTCIMASEKHGDWVKEMLEYYENDRPFIKTDGTYDMTTNVQIIGRLMSAEGFVLQNGYQVYKNCIHIFPKDYFCPQDRSGKIKITSNTYCIHHFSSSWQTPYMKMKKFFFRQILGPEITDFCIKSKWKILGLLKIYKK